MSVSKDKDSMIKQLKKQIAALTEKNETLKDSLIALKAKYNKLLREKND